MRRDYCSSNFPYLIALFIMFDFHFYCALKNPLSFCGLQEERSQSGFSVCNERFNSTWGSALLALMFNEKVRDLFKGSQSRFGF